MCLNKVIAKFKDVELSGRGYKCFARSGKNINFPLYSSYDCKIGTWLEANTEYLTAEDGQTYDSGFHILLKKHDANKYKIYGEVVLDVLFEGVVAIGTEGCGKEAMETVIAKRIYIPESQKSLLDIKSTPIKSLKVPPTKKVQKTVKKQKRDKFGRFV